MCAQLSLVQLGQLSHCLGQLQVVGGRQHTLHSGVPPAEQQIGSLGKVNGRAEDAPQQQQSPSISRQPNCYQGLWIVKPAKLSRGRGIRVFSTLPELLSYTRGGGKRVSTKWTGWIVMKYIERPLTIGKRKWDMRQWVLVTSWNPLVSLSCV